MRSAFTKTLLLVSVVVVAAGFAGCTKKQPQDVVRDMTMKMAAVDSYHVDVDGTFTGHSEDWAEWADQSRGNQDLPTTLKLKGSGDVELRDDAPALQGTVRAQVENSEAGLLFDLDMISINQRSFIKFIEAPVVGVFDLSALRGPWYQVDSYRDLLAESKDGGASEQLSAGEVAQLRDLVRQTDFLAVVDDLGTENLNGLKTNHYRVKPQVENIRDFAIRAAEIADEPLSDEDREKMDEDLALLADLTAEVWIGAKDGYLYRVTSAADDLDHENLRSYALTVDFSNFNQQIEITPPAESREFDLTGAVVLPGVQDFMAEPIDGADFDNPPFDQQSLDEMMRELEKFEMFNSQEEN